MASRCAKVVAGAGSVKSTAGTYTACTDVIEPFLVEVIRSCIAPISVARVGCSAQIKAMKQVAGTIKFELAQYREMAAFAQFASDMDASTQALLARGERLTELLKQSQYSPMLVEEQVAVIFAGVKGYLDQIPTQQIGEFEQSLIQTLNAKGSNILESIRKDKSISDDTEKALKDTLDELVKNFG